METPPSDELLSAALRLPTGDRARLAHELLKSLDEAADPDAADAWLEEIERRSQEIASGAVTPLDWESVRERLAQRWRKT